MGRKSRGYQGCPKWDGRGGNRCMFVDNLVHHPLSCRGHPRRIQLPLRQKMIEIVKKILPKKVFSSIRLCQLKSFVLALSVRPDPFGIRCDPLQPAALKSRRPLHVVRNFATSNIKALHRYMTTRLIQNLRTRNHCNIITGLS